VSRWVARRLLASLITLFGITTITFLLARVVPSDPAVVYIGPLARPAEIARVTKQLGLDRPIYVQYGSYLRELANGDWGRSLATKEPVLGGIATRLPATLELIFVAMALALAIGIPLGILAAYRKGGVSDTGVRVGSVIGISIPVFWLGLLLQVLMAQWLHLLPATSRISLETSVLHPIPKVTGFLLVDSLVSGDWSGFHDAAMHIILPAITLAAYPAALITRMTRAAMLDVLGQDYIRTARTFGLGERLVLWRLALRNAMPTTLTVSGLSLAYLITGSFFVEIVFDWPGIGQYATNALLNVDYPAIMGITLLGAFAFLTINFVVDLIQAKLDPRIRLQ
jgi:ABC-type dipeptide/oligopeptide/nickel transport system permease component